MTPVILHLGVVVSGVAVLILIVLGPEVQK